LRQLLALVGEAQLLRRLRVVAPLHEIGREVAVIELLRRCAGAARSDRGGQPAAGRAADTGRSRHVLSTRAGRGLLRLGTGRVRPAGRVAGGVTEGAQIGEELLLRLARALARGDDG